MTRVGTKFEEDLFYATKRAGDVAANRQHAYYSAHPSTEQPFDWARIFAEEMYRAGREDEARAHA